MSRLLRNWVIVFLCLTGLGFALWGVNCPFVGIYNTNNNYLSLAARNYQRFGFEQLKFFPTYFAGEHFTSHDPYYLHHPILIFLLSAVPQIIFGFSNWSVHATNFLFLVGAVVMIYILAKELWGRRVAMWAGGLASIFPMTTFFWKYIFFEQASLFFNLLIYYLFIRYCKKQSIRLVLFIFLFTVLSGLIDWGVLYLLFPFFILVLSADRKHFIKPFFVYLAGSVFSLGLFVTAVYLLQHGFKELGSAIWGRSYTAELTSLSWWPIRLFLISIVRMILYFTPLSIAAVWYAYREIRGSRRLPGLTLAFFFTYGLLNLIFLPAASWGHSYFLFYFIPFFAWSGGIFLEKIEKKVWVIGLWVVVIVLTSFFVNYLKIQQVKKQLWKYDVAVGVNKIFKPYEIIGVVNYPGDVFENYFLHPSQPIEYGKLNAWLNGTIYPEILNTLYVCAGACTSDELHTAASLQQEGLVKIYEVGGNTAWLITKHPLTRIGTTSATELIHSSNDTQIHEGNIILRIYRLLRDTLNVGQI